jgi:nucleoside-triphosphatase THEP1
MQTKLILWTGEKHCGKTTSVASLVDIVRSEGFGVAGILAPSIYHNGKLLGFDALDLQSETRVPLARRNVDRSKTIQFTLLTEGLRLGNTALSMANTDSADLVIVDEFGPWELDGQGWRKNVDSLLAESNALIVLVVRQELADRVQQLYGNSPSRTLQATEPESANTVITILRSRLQSQL